jgi:hypothetical protein
VLAQELRQWLAQLGLLQNPEDLLLGVVLLHGPGGLVFHPALSLKPLQFQGGRSE